MRQNNLVKLAASRREEIKERSRDIAKIIPHTAFVMSSAAQKADRHHSKKQSFGPMTPQIDISTYYITFSILRTCEIVITVPDLCTKIKELG